MKKYLIALTFTSLVVSLMTIPAFSQDNREPGPPAPATGLSGPSDEVVTPPEEMSIYGEVKSTDEATNTIKLQYYDYDDDEEKTAEIVIDIDTKLENAAAIRDIKQGDWIDAVYLPEGNVNLAKSIIVERDEEEAPPAMIPQDGDDAV